MAAPAVTYANDITLPSSRLIRLQLGTGMEAVRLSTSTPLTVEDRSGARLEPTGAFTFTPETITPAKQRWHIFPKTFQPGEEALAEAYIAQWHERGYNPESIQLGLKYSTESGAVLDNRIHWISLARFPTEAEALDAKKRLEQESVWAWVRREKTEEGSGVIAMDSPTGRRALTLPVTLRCDSPIHVTGLDGGEPRSFTGALDIRAGADGELELYESVPIETYLAGVLPGEMPALWPLETLKAQAIAARSDVLAHLALKHKLEGFDYTTNEQNRVYVGHGKRDPRTDTAVAATAGEVAAHGGRVVPCVFSANCGGWTADNDTVWSSPPDPMLRARPDFPAGAGPAAQSVAQYGLTRWLTTRPPAHCSGDQRHFRWTKTYSVQEISAMVDKRYNVGPIRSIELGDRGAGGRLKWVRIQGANGAEIIRKEYPIRLAFGGLPSAMFTLDTKRGPSGPVTYTFTGGGRGHGVGMCQHGAHGMANRGANAHEIIRHYYAGIDIAKVKQ